MSTHNFFQLTLSLLDKRYIGKTKKAEPDLKLWTLRPKGPTT